METFTASKVSKYGVISGPFFPVFGLNIRSTPYLSVFSLNTGKYGPEITPYLDTFHAVAVVRIPRDFNSRKSDKSAKPFIKT